MEFIEESPGSLKEQLSFASKLKNDHNDLMVFFSEKKPLRYKWDYILFVKDLKETHYWSESNSLKKAFTGMLLNTGIERAKKIICFENHTRSELNEKLNVAEAKLETIHPFFTKQKSPEWITLSDVKTKYSIKWDFFIYSGWTWTHKNLSKLVDVFKRLSKRKKDIFLVILDQKATEDVYFRQEVVDGDIVDKVFFIWDTSLDEKKSFYNQAAGTIFPSLYESFPFSLTEAISYNSPILASSINQIQEIMGDSIAYFSPVSTIDITEAIENFITLWDRDCSYDSLFERLNPKKSAENLIEIINDL